MTATSREEDTSVSHARPAATRVGQFYLDVSARRLHCLNDTARQLRDEGLPLTPDAATLPHLQTLEGLPVLRDQLPTLVAARDGRPAEEEFLLTRPGHAVRRLHWCAAPLKDASGRTTAVCVSITDGPPPPHWDEMAGLAHDLRTPLHALGLLVALLREPALPEDQRREALARVQAVAERAGQIGHDLLDWCRAAGALGRPVQPAWFALEPFLLDIIAELRPEAGRKGLTLVAGLLPILGWQVFTDRPRLGRVVANLLVNAVRYTPGGGRVSLTAQWEDRGAERFLVLAVVDTGAGISPEEQESIFNPYERGRSGRESESGGSGIGLSVVDRVTQELGLQRELVSESGRGSSFRVLVPLRLLRLAPPSHATSVGRPS